MPRGTVGGTFADRHRDAAIDREVVNMDRQDLDASTEMHGGCLCGKVRYVIHEAPALTALCHCTHCQKQSGSAFSVNLVVASAVLDTVGVLATFVDTADSGQKLERKFCPCCGSPVYTRPLGNPAVTYLKAGTLDDTTRVRPDTQVWVASAQQWVSINAHLVTFQRGTSP